MATDQSPLDLHNGNCELSLHAPPVNEMTELAFAAISIQTRPKKKSQKIQQKKIVYLFAYQIFL